MDAPALSMQSQYNAVRCGRTFPSYALRDVGLSKTTAGTPHPTRCMRSIGVGVSASVAVGYGARATGDEEWGQDTDAGYPPAASTRADRRNVMPRRRHRPPARPMRQARPGDRAARLAANACMQGCSVPAEVAAPGRGADQRYPVLPSTGQLSGVISAAAAVYVRRALAPAFAECTGVRVAGEAEAEAGRSREGRGFGYLHVWVQAGLRGTYIYGRRTRCEIPGTRWPTGSARVPAQFGGPLGRLAGEDECAGRGSAASRGCVRGTAADPSVRTWEARSGEGTRETRWPGREGRHTSSRKGLTNACAGVWRWAGGSAGSGAQQRPAPKAGGGDRGRSWACRWEQVIGVCAPPSHGRARRAWGCAMAGISGQRRREGAEGV
ncbi:predicted protein [Postia placenta Mad-698-R]|nr:predicted protein [Postia placenta Mad-698-R]